MASAASSPRTWTVSAGNRMSAAGPARQCAWAPDRVSDYPAIPLEGVQGVKAYQSASLMRSKYCIRYELGLCPKYQGAKPPQELFLLNNGRRLALRFDCAACEMTVHAV